MGKHSLPAQAALSFPSNETQRQATLPTEPANGGSEVARLLQQIDREYEAAQRGLSGLRSGAARHDFINARMEQVAVCHEQLSAHVGEEEATRLIHDHYVQRIG